MIKVCTYSRENRCRYIHYISCLRCEMSLRLRHVVDNESNSYILVSTGCKIQLYKLKCDAYQLLFSWIKENEVLDIDIIHSSTGTVISIMILLFDGSLSVNVVDLVSMTECNYAILSGSTVFYGGRVSYLNSALDSQSIAVAIIGAEKYIVSSLFISICPKFEKAATKLPEDLAVKTFQSSAKEVIEIMPSSSKRHSILCKFKSKFLNYQIRNWLISNHHYI